MIGLWRPDLRFNQFGEIYFRPVLFLDALRILVKPHFVTALGYYGSVCFAYRRSTRVTSSTGLRNWVALILRGGLLEFRWVCTVPLVDCDVCLAISIPSTHAILLLCLDCPFSHSNVWWRRKLKRAHRIMPSHDMLMLFESSYFCTHNIVKRCSCCVTSMNAPGSFGPTESRKRLPTSAT